VPRREGPGPPSHLDRDPPPPPPPPPPEPPPSFPPHSLIDTFAAPPRPAPAVFTLTSGQATLTHLPQFRSIADSVTHITCNPWICGLRGDPASGAQVLGGANFCDGMIDGNSNICVTGDLAALVDDVFDIPPVAISVAIEGSPASFDDCITKRGLLPLSISDGTIYYQPCFYCANLVETPSSLRQRFLRLVTCS
jgi:hypothetical protein